MKSLKRIFTGTFLSILVFFSISFLTVLSQMNPLRDYFKSDKMYELYIGFPFKYYYQFRVRGNDYPNSSWMVPNLFYDCVVTWVVVAGIYYLAVRKNNR